MKTKEKIAILSVSILTIIATSAIGPALGAIHKEFLSAAPLLIKLILTLPALICIPVSLSISHITKKVSKKTTIIIGILLYTIGGLLAVVVNSIYFLLISRAILGLGLGLIAPLSLVIIGDFFEGKERAKFMGYSAAISNMGAVLAIIIVGILASIGWRDVFYVYLIGVVVLALVIFFLPKEDIKENEIERELENLKFNKEVFKYAIIVILAFLIFYSVPTNIALLVSSKAIGGPAVSGYLIATMTLCAFISGIFFNHILKIFKSFISVFSFLLMTIGVSMIALFSSLTLMYLSVILIGIGFGLVVPYAMYSASKCVHVKYVTLAISIIATSIYVGEFFSPIILDYIASLLKLNNIIGSFYGAAILSFISILLGIYISISSRNGREKQDNYA